MPAIKNEDIERMHLKTDQIWAYDDARPRNIEVVWPDSAKERADELIMLSQGWATTKRPSAIVLVRPTQKAEASALDPNTIEGEQAYVVYAEYLSHTTELFQQDPGSLSPHRLRNLNAYILRAYGTTVEPMTREDVKKLANDPPR